MHRLWLGSLDILQKLPRKGGVQYERLVPLLASNARFLANTIGLRTRRHAYSARSSLSLASLPTVKDILNTQQFQVRHLDGLDVMVALASGTIQNRWIGQRGCGPSSHLYRNKTIYGVPASVSRPGMSSIIHHTAAGRG